MSGALEQTNLSGWWGVGRIWRDRNTAWRVADIVVYSYQEVTLILDIRWLTQEQIEDLYLQELNELWAKWKVLTNDSRIRVPIIKRKDTSDTLKITGLKVRTCNKKISYEIIWIHDRWWKFPEHVSIDFRVLELAMRWWKTIESISVWMIGRFMQAVVWLSDSEIQ